MKMRAWLRALIRFAVGVLAGYLAYLAALAMNRSEVPAILMGVVGGVAVALLLETWQNNRRSKASRRKPGSRADNKAP